MENGALNNNWGNEKTFNNSARHGDIRVTFVLITVEKAKDFLAGNQQNRTKSEKTIRRLASAMASGRYRVTHQGIAFDKNGVMVDGQHRLEAIVMSGVAQWMLVTTGLDPIVRAVIDCGRLRRAFHADEIINGESNARKKANILNSIRRLGYGNTDELTYDALVDLKEKYRDAMQWAAEHVGANGRFGSGPVLGAFIHAYKSNPEKVKQAYSDLVNDSMLPGDPLRLLRETIVSVKQLQARATAVELFHQTLAAIHARLSGDQVRRLRRSAARTEWFDKAY